VEVEWIPQVLQLAIEVQRSRPALILGIQLIEKLDFFWRRTSTKHELRPVIPHFG
jgi:hypothetical protein